MAVPQEAHAPAWSIRLAFELSANDQTAQALVAGLSEEQLNWRPQSGSWGVGQCLEHLCMTNEAYIAPIWAAIRERPDTPVEQITPGRFSAWFIRKFVEPSPTSKPISAPRKVRPGTHVGLSVLDRFLHGNRSCRQLIIQARTKDVNRIRFWNPFVPGLRFTVGMGLEIISSHERRHLLQAERVRDALKLPH